MTSRREARRARNREDFERATREGLREAGHTKLLADAGKYAGPTIRESIEDEIRKAVRLHNKIEQQCLNPDVLGPDPWSATGVEHKRKAARGVIRGLCKALLIVETPYRKDDRDALLRMEKEFLNEGKDNG